MEVDYVVRSVAKQANSRIELWKGIFSALGRGPSIVEVGVWKGEFAEEILKHIPLCEYYMIDPWRTLPDWNKPANWEQKRFDEVYDEAMARTAFARSRTFVIRERTIEAAAKIPDNDMDAVYVDGDHTLRGISIDLITMLPKVREGGILCGDDFTKSVWQHSDEYDPTMIFPFAVYFAEAHGLPIYALPFNQFLIHKDPSRGFAFIDLAGGYQQTTMLEALRKPKKSLRRRIKELVM